MQVIIVQFISCCGAEFSFRFLVWFLCVERSKSSDLVLVVEIETDYSGTKVHWSSSRLLCLAPGPNGKTSSLVPNMLSKDVLSRKQSWNCRAAASSTAVWTQRSLLRRCIKGVARKLDSLLTNIWMQLKHYTACEDVLSTILLFLIYNQMKLL